MRIDGMKILVPSLNGDFKRKKQLYKSYIHT